MIERHRRPGSPLEIWPCPMGRTLGGSCVGTIWALAMVLALTLFGAAPAVAKNRLDRASPGADSSVTAPSAVHLTFAFPVDAKATTVSIVRSNGAEIAVARVTAAAKDGKILIVVLTKPLDPGKYLVEWRVAPPGALPLQGRYTFTVLGLIAPG